MNSEALKLTVHKILKKLGVSKEKIIPYMSLREDYRFDELDWHCFLFYLESRFNISIEEREMVELATVGSTINFIDRKLSNNSTH